MQVKGTGSRILRSSDKTRGNKDRKREDKNVLDWPTPKEVKDIQKFLGLANYYCLFIRYFVVIAKPLYDMITKD